jgi:hypothetical protein
MKKIIILVFIFVTCFVQAQEPEPDSLVGIYVGTKYHSFNNGQWTLSQDTIIIDNVDTLNCELVISNFFWIGSHFSAVYSTDYSFCETITNPDEFGFYPYFYFMDSLKVLYEVPQPYPYTEREKWHFYGKRIPNSSYVGLNEVEPVNIRLNLYPNPSCDILFFDFPGSDMINCNVTIRNVFGSIVYCDEVSGEKCFIDVSGFADGIYFFELNNGVLVYNKRFVVNR